MNNRSLVRVLCFALALVLLPALTWGAGKIVMRMGDNQTDRQNTWGAVIEQINADFLKDHPNLSFETESYPDQPYQEKIKLYATSGQLPDVMKYWSLPSMLKPMVDAKLAAELPYNDFKALNFIPGSLEVNMMGGKLYGVTTNSDFWVIYYNKRLFKDAGVAVPATIEDLLASVQDKVSAAYRVLAVALSGPSLLQMAVWAGLALAVGFTLSLRHMLARLWAWSLTMCLVFVLYRVVPIRFWDYRVNLSALLVGVSVLAVVVLFAVVFDVGQRPEERRDERP